MNENFKTVLGDIKKERNLDKTVYDYLREFERKGVIEVKRDNNKYLYIRLTKKALQQLNDQMLTPFSNDIRRLVLKLDEGSAPKVEVDDNLINFALSSKPELSSLINLSRIIFL
jgi:DNA-binding PadR family transcriptional regulator